MAESSLPTLVSPMDEYNRTLVSHVHPPDWVNPKPAEKYNLVVIGAGTAGLVTAAAAATLGAKVALVEKHLLGGDCLNVGCVPSKALIRSARAAADVRYSDDFGVPSSGEASVDFPEVMRRMRRLRAGISHHDSTKRFQDLGVEVFLGEARFTARDQVELDDGTRLRFRKAVIATGARAIALPIPGLKEAGYLTNETVFSLTELPPRLAVIGAGPIGVEMAQSFQRFGSQVTLIEIGDQILTREDPDAAAIVAAAIQRDGVAMALGVKTEKVELKNGARVIHLQDQSGRRTIEVDQILLGVGRAPNVEGLDLETAGVEYDKNGVTVDSRLRTSNSRIYAAGDICFPYKFTHTADAMARMVIQNALFLGRKKTDDLIIPWVTYTDPEIGHVGQYEHEAKERGIEVETFIQKMDEVDRAVVEGETEGLVKIHVRKGTDRILGATIVARHAGEMISEITLAMNSGIGLGKISGVIHPYPTQAEAIRKAADAYNRTRLTPFVKKLLRRWLEWTR